MTCFALYLLVCVFCLVVHEAADGINELSQADEQLVRELAKDLKSADPKRRLKAAKSIYDLGALAEVAILELNEALGDENDSVQTQVAMTLSFLGRSAIPLLEKTLTSEVPRTRRGAALALEGIAGSGLPKSSVLILLKTVKDKDPEVRRVSARALYRTEDPTTIPTLVEVLANDQDREVRGEVVSLLGSLGSEAKSAVPVLIDLLKKELARSRVEKNDQSAMGTLALRDGIVYSLAGIGKPATPELVKLMKDRSNDMELRALAIRAIHSMFTGYGDGIESAQGALPALIDLIGRPGEDLRLVYAAVEALAEFRGRARKAAPFLVALIKTSKVYPNVEAAYALYRIDPKNALSIPVLLEGLSHREADLRKMSALRLKQLQPKDPAVVKGFMKALKDEEEFVRQQAANGLGRLGRYASNAVPYLAAVSLQDKSEGVQHAAWQALVDIVGRDRAEKALEAVQRKE